jgi:ArsR family transcriptional regulator
MKLKPNKTNPSHLAEMMAAMGNEQRLNVMRLLLSSHPEGMVVGDIQAEVGIPNSTLSHHLEKLKIVGLVNVKRESQYLRYSANTDALEELLTFLFSECCRRSTAIKPETLISICR